MLRGSWLVFGLLLGCLTHADHAAAQLYQWRDSNGRVVFSDTPPPPNTPAGNIIKTPKGRSAPPPAAAATAAATPPNGAAKDGGGAPAAVPAGDSKSAAASGPKSIAERDAEYKKRQADAAEKAKKDQDATAEAQRREGICRGLRNNLASLEGGQRVRKVDDKGEPYFVDDAERAKDISRMRQELTTSKCG
jgi:hypothetical protein